MQPPTSINEHAVSYTFKRTSGSSRQGSTPAAPPTVTTRLVSPTSSQTAHTTIQAYGVVRLELQPVQRSAWKKTPPPSSNVPLSHITDSRKTTSRDQEVEGRLRRIATSASGDSEDTTASDQHLTAPRIGLQPTVPTRIQRHAPRTANCDQQCECGPKRRHAQCSSWRRTRT